MNLLVVGGDHTYGHGLVSGRSFVEHFVHRLEQDRQRVAVDYYTPATLKMAFTLLPQLSLERYDLIILQLGNYELQQPDPFSALLKTTWHKTGLATAVSRPTEPMTIAELRYETATQLAQRPPHRRDGFKRTGRLALLRSLAFLGCLPRLWAVKLLFNTVFHQLRGHRRRVIALTPFPHREPVSHWLRQKGQRLMLRAGRRHGISVFDTHKHIRTGEEYFLGSGQAYLNAISHELIGRELYDFYQAEPTIVSVMPSKPNLNNDGR